MATYKAVRRIDPLNATKYTWVIVARTSGGAESAIKTCTNEAHAKGVVRSLRASHAASFR